MTTIHNPPTLGVPPSYSHGIEVAAGARTLYTAGQVGWDAGGNIEKGIAAQTRLAFANLRSILQNAGMDLANIVNDDLPDRHRARLARNMPGCAARFSEPPSPPPPWSSSSSW